jgi:GNAT superfamily N-acetyltransferase
MGSVGKFRALTVELGWTDAILYAFRTLLARSTRSVRIIRYDILAQPVPEGPLLPPGRGRSIEVRRIHEGDPCFARLPLTGPVIRYRYGQNAICLVACRDGDVLGCLWLCLDGYDEDEVRCRFVPCPEDATAWDFDVYVHPDHRASLVFARLWDEANAFLRERGIRWSASRISPFNPRSMSSHLRLGAIRRARLTALCVGRWQLIVSSLRPRVHLSFRRGAVPEFRVEAPARAERPGDQPAEKRYILTGVRLSAASLTLTYCNIPIISSFCLSSI